MHVSHQEASAKKIPGCVQPENGKPDKSDCSKYSRNHENAYRCNLCDRIKNPHDLVETDCQEFVHLSPCSAPLKKVN